MRVTDQANARTVWLLSHFQATAGASLHLFLTAGAGNRELANGVKSGCPLEQLDVLDSDQDVE